MRKIKRTYRHLRHKIRCAYQRVVRGWDITAYWGTDGWLTKHLGEILVYSADNAHGWPGECYGTFEDWTRDMRVAGEALLAYNHVSLAANDFDVHEQAAKNALFWVADNLSALWD